VRRTEGAGRPAMASEIDIAPVSTDRFRSVLGNDRYDEFERAAKEGQTLLAGRAVWNINSTAKGGGVVELLRPLIGYARGNGIDARWIVIEGSDEFFTITKRIHNRLHGSPGDGGPLDETARQVYEQVLAENLPEVVGRVREGDVVIVHDPQPAGMVPGLKEAGASVIWRCHVGLDEPNELTRETWAFLRPYIIDADAYVFSRRAFAWEGLPSDRIVVIHPTIDVFSPKNEDLDAETVSAVVRACGVVADGPTRPVTFRRHDRSPGRVERRARVVEQRPLGMDDPVVLQISRWDTLKDPIGVIRGFAEHVPESTGAHLVYGGPDVEAVADDPEGLRVLRESTALLEQLPEEPRSRIHLVTLPMADETENAIMVNALQRHARVVVQKSLAEGFGLTVAEAMWKARPVVASRIGGIQEQIAHGDNGILLDDPLDLAAFGAAVAGLLGDPERAETIGRRARERVRDRFVSLNSLLDYLGVIRRLAKRRSGVAAS
jgi:trehalose synthase